MSQENVEIVRAAVDAYNRRDWNSVLKDAGPDFELDFSHAVGPNRGVFGLDQTRGIMDEITEHWESLRIEPHEFMEADEHVVVPWTLHTAGRDGIEVQARTTWVWTIRDGAITRITMDQQREDALEAAGLSE
jgi:ketosteroid isomerase-like protein